MTHDGEERQMCALLKLVVDKIAEDPNKNQWPSPAAMLQHLRLTKNDFYYRSSTSGTITPEQPRLKDASVLKKAFHRWLQQKIDKDIDLLQLLDYS